MFGIELNLRGLLLAGGLLLAFIAAVTGVYYAGHRAGVKAEQLKQVAADLSATQQAAASVVAIGGDYERLLVDVFQVADADDCPVSARVRAAVDGVRARRASGY